MQTIIAALIGAAAAVIVQLCANHAVKKAADAKQAARDQEFLDRLQRIEEHQRDAKADNDERMERIEEHLREHNNYAKMFASVTTDIDWLKQAAMNK